MMKPICAAVAVLAMAAPALAQQTDLPDRKATQTNKFDPTPVKEANTQLRLNGKCVVEYVVSTEGRAKDVTADCTHPEMIAPAVKVIQSGTWDPEVFDHEFFDSFPIKQDLSYGAGSSGPDPRGEKPPQMDQGLKDRDIQRIISQVDKEGACDVRFTVGADGKPKDIQPNCTPAVFNDKIAESIGNMKYKPGQKGGAPTDWPGMAMPLNLNKP